MGAVLVALVTGTATLGPFLAPHDPLATDADRLVGDDGIPLGPADAVEGHPLGGDTLGRDMLSRLLHGGKVSMLVAYVATALAVLIGVLIGIATGYFGGPLDFLAMRFIDVLLSIPFLLVAIAIQRVWENPALWSLILLLGFLSWTSLARVTRAKTQQVRGLEYVQAARALGMGHGRVLFRHVLPNVMGPIIVLSTTMVAEMIIAESALSFLGLGVKPPTPSWGSMLREGQDYLSVAPRLLLYPAAFIVATVFGFNLLGEGLRDALDPKD